MHRVVCLDLELLQLQINYFCIFSPLIIHIRTFVTSATCTILDIANYAKIVIFPLTARFHILHNISTFSIFWNMLLKVSLFFKFFVIMNIGAEGFNGFISKIYTVFQTRKEWKPIKSFYYLYITAFILNISRD